MRSVLFFLSLALFCSTGFSALAQEGWNWPEDKGDEAKRVHKEFKAQLEKKDFASARPNAFWLLNNAPNLHVSLYADAATVYKGLSLVETDKLTRKSLADSCMRMYDVCRMDFPKSYPQASHATDAYAVLKRYRSLMSLNYLHGVMKGAVDNDAALKPDVLVGYMKTTHYYREKGAPVSDMELVQTFKKVDKALEVALADPKQKTNLAKYKHQNKLYLNKSITLTCDYIKQKAGGDGSELSPEQGEEVLTLLSMVDCPDKSLKVKATQALFKGKPTLKLLLSIANGMVEAKEYDNALTQYEKGYELAKTPAEKAGLNLSIASLKSKKGKKSEARTLALEAVKIDPSSAKKAYTLIGDLYVGSFKSLKKGVNRVHDNAIYILAYDMYKKAGNAAKMKVAKASMPTKEHLFSYQIKEGTPFKIGGWVSRTVKLRAR